MHHELVKAPGLAHMDPWIFGSPAAEERHCNSQYLHVVDTTEKRMPLDLRIKELGKDIISRYALASPAPQSEIALPESIIVPLSYHEFARDGRKGTVSRPTASRGKGTVCYPPIAQGCLGNCHNVSPKLHRGNLKSTCRPRWYRIQGICGWRTKDTHHRPGHSLLWP